MESQELVLDVGKKNKVILARKIPGQRSQLWKMTQEGQCVRYLVLKCMKLSWVTGYLQHEGSIPPSHPNAPRKKDNILVLDIADTAPQPNYYSR